MKGLPCFVPAAVVPIDEGKLGTHVDYKNLPTCSACGITGWDLDVAGLCRGCWRAGPWAAAHLEARGLGSQAREELRRLEHENQLLHAALRGVDPDAWSRVFPGGVRSNTGDLLVAPLDELAEQRTAREVPRLTDTSGPTGVALDVALAPQPRAPRKRP